MQDTKAYILIQGGTTRKRTVSPLLIHAPAIGGQSLVKRDSVTTRILPVRNARWNFPRLLILNGNL